MQLPSTPAANNDPTRQIICVLSRLHKPIWDRIWVKQAMPFHLIFIKFTLCSYGNPGWAALREPLFLLSVCSTFIRCKMQKNHAGILKRGPYPCPLFQPVTLKLRRAVTRRTASPVTSVARRSVRKTCVCSGPQGPEWTAPRRAPTPRATPRPGASACPTESSSVISVG